MNSNTKSHIDTWLDDNIFHGKRGGTYIECGANDGIRDSITYSFEKEYGWHGLLVEPIPTMMSRCKKHRSTANMFLQKALGDEDKKVTLTVPDDNLDNSSVALSKIHKDHLEKLGYGKTYSQLHVDMISYRTLVDISHWKQFDLAVFDVEGYENHILRSMMCCPDNLPKVLVVEYDWSDLNELTAIVAPKYTVASTFKHDVVFVRK